MKEPLTHAQQKVLDYVTEFARLRGYPPTIREIARHLRLASPRAVQKHLGRITEKGYIRRSPGSARGIDIVGRPAAGASRAVPVVGRVRAGAPDLAAEDIEGHVALDRSLARWPNAFLLRVEGDSMIGAHIAEGDLALVKPQPAAENGEIVVALVGDEATIKRLHKSGEAITLLPENPKYRPIVVKKGEGEVRIVGKVVAIIRDLERSHDDRVG